MIIATVVQLVGQAWARDAEGNLRALAEGDQLREGEVVITGNGARVRLEQVDGAPLVEMESNAQILLTQDIAEGSSEGEQAPVLEDPDVARVLALLEESDGDLLDILEAPAAGAAGGAGVEGGHDFVRLLRIVEEVTPLSFEYGYQRVDDELPQQEGGGSDDVDEPVTLTGLDGPQGGTGGAVGTGGAAVGFASAEQTVSESGLATGSSPATGSIVSGSFGVSAPDGLTSITVGSSGPISLDRLNGLAGNPLVINTPHGTLTLTGYTGGATGGTVSYTFELTTPVDNDSADGATGDGLVESIVITATDTDGSTTSGFLDIAILDDAPQAFDDTAETQEDTPITYNVLANDVEGADGATLTTATLRDPSQGSVSINAAGDVTFTPAPGFEGEALIDYTITDADGDTSDAVFSVTVAEDSTPTISVPDDSPSTEGGQFTVSEAGLAGGSAAGDGSQTTSGTLPITTGGDSLASLVINGVNVTAGGTVVGDFGTLTVSVSDAGDYSWSYTLDDSTQDHTSQGTGSDDLADQFAITATDSDGDEASTDLTIQVQDDVPVAVNDSANTAEDTPITYNVLANDTQGVDGATLTAATLRDPSQGSVSINAAGDVTFTPAPGFEGEALIDYTITDADGDTSDAVFSVTVAEDSTPTISVPDDSPSTEGGQFTVSEAGLAGGSAAGDGSQTTSGTLPITTGGDSLASLVINGVNVTAGGTVVGDFGTLTVSVSDAGDYSWSYTLDGSTQDHTSQGTGSDDLADQFAITATDSDGDEASTDLTIQVQDDVPVAVNDTANTAEDTPITYNVLDNDTQGVDGATLTSATLRDPSQGSVSINAAGDVTFTPAPGFEGEALIDYTITDADGDTSDAVFSVTVAEDSTPTISVPDDSPNTEGGQFTVSEAGLPGGSAAGDGSQTTSGTLPITTGGDSLASLVINGVNVTAGGTVVGDFGTLTVSVSDAGDYSWSYTLDGSTQDHTSQGTGSDDLADQFAITATDSDGDDASTDLTIQVQDDVPVAVNDSANTAEDTPITYNVLDNDTQGVDGANVSAATLRNPSQGSVSFNSDTGEVTFTPAPGFEGEALIDYTITDADGDTSDAVFSVTVAEDSTPTISVPDDSPSTEGGQFTVSEAGLPGGSAAGDGSQTTSGTLPITTGGDSLASLVINGVNVTAGGTVVGDFGTLTVSVSDAGDYSWSYTLDGSTQDHTSQGTGSDDLADQFAITATDSDGDDASTDLTIQVQDDVPVAVNDSASVAEDTAQAISGNVLANDTTGADSSTAQPATVALDSPSATGEFGTLTLNSDGSWSYTLNNSDARVQALSGDETLTETFAYTLTDADGDTSPATLTITVTATDDGVSLSGLKAEGGDVQVSEANLADGSAADSTSLTRGGSFTFTSVDGVASVQVGDQSLTLNQLQGLSTTNPVVVDTAYGSLSLTGFDGDAAGGTVSYSYTLDTRVDNDSQDGATDSGFTETVGLVVTDDNGSASSGSLRIAIADDAPSASDDSASVAEDTAQAISGNVLANDTTGADSSTAQPATVALDSPSATGEFGTLTLNSDGSWSYTLNNSDARVQALSGDETLTETFAYTLTDADGDTSPATLTITVTATDDGVSLSGLAADGGDVQVSEANLADGSAADSTALTRGGSFTFTSVDGVASVQVGDQSLTLNQLQGLSTTNPVVIDTAYGSLSLTGFDGDAAGGTVSYSYTLDTRVDNDSQDGATGSGFTETVGLVVTDDNGTRGQASISIAITDDGPSLQIGDSTEPGTATVVEGQSVNGSWTTDAGADGATVTVTVGGDSLVLGSAADATVSFDLTEGTLTVGRDGSWTFEANNNLDQAENPSVNFTIETVDSDGDTASDSHTVTITDGTGPTVTVTDSDPATTNAAVSLDDADTEGDASSTDVASLTFTAGSDAIASIGFGSTDNIDVDGLNGTLTWTLNSAGQLEGRTEAGGEPAITLTLNNNGSVTAGQSAVVTVTATLADSLVHADGVDALTISGITVVGTDTDGSSTEASVSVSVADDQPTLQIGDSTEPGTATVVEGQSVNGSWTTDAGADGATVTVSVGSETLTLGDADNDVVTFNTAEGVLTVGRDGSWTFEANNNLDQAENPSINFTIETVDSDGDTASDSHTVTITDGTGPTVTVTDSDPASTNAAVSLDDAETEGDASSTDVASLTFTAGSDAIASIGFGSTDNIDVDGLNGTLTWTLNSAGQLEGRTEAGGEPAITLTLNNNGSVTAGQSAVVTVTATLADSLAHADGVDALTISGITVVGTDTDGTSTSANVGVTVADDQPTLQIGDSTEPGTATVVEGQSVNGSWTTDAGADGATVTVSVGGDSQVLGSAADATVSFDLTEGTLTVGRDGSWTFEANNNLDQAESPSVNFTISTVDTDGDTASDSHTVTITDGTGPTVTVTDSDPATTNAAVSLDDADTEGDASSTDVASLTFTAGSDAIASIGFGSTDNIDVDGLNGTLTWTLNSAGQLEGRTEAGGEPAITLTLNNNGSVTAGQSAVVTVTATLADSLAHADGVDALTISGITVVGTDTDGTSTSANVGVTVADDQPTLQIGDSTEPGTATVVEGQSVNGSWTTDAGADGATVTVSVGSETLTLGDADNDVVTFNTAEGVLTVGRDGSWTFEANNNLDQAESPSVNFTIETVDSDGDTASDSHTVTITDGTGPTVTVTDSDPASTNAAVSLDDAETEGDASSTDVASLTFTAGSDAIASIGFGDTGAISVDGLDGTLTWTLDSAGQLEGRSEAGGEPAITLTLNNNGSVAAGQSAVVTVTATLADSLAHADGVDALTISGITVVGTDTDGSSTEASVSVSVADDQPTLQIGDSTEPGTATVVEGQSVNGSWTTDAGADGATVTVSVGSETLTLGDGDADVVIFTTAEGVLTVGRDGSWTFEANNNLDQAESPSINFTIETVDSDGDTASDSHTVNVTDGTGPTVTVTSGDDDPATESLDLTLDEVGTIGGAEQDSGVLTFTAGSDNLTSFRFANIATDGSVSGITTAGLEPGQTLVWTANANGQLEGRLGGSTAVAVTLSLAAPASVEAGEDGIVRVTAELSEALPHEVADALANSLSISGIGVVATEADGDSATAQVTVNVVDSAPQAVADVNAITEDTASVSGNVIDGAADDAGADTLGADATTVTAVTSDNASGNTATTNADGELVFQGEYGTLTIAPDGSYSYALDNTNPAVQGLDGSESVTEVFTYTLTDADSDASSTTLTLTINGQEDDLPTITVTDSDGNVTGADNSVEEDSGDTVTGTFTVGGSAGVASVTIGGVELVGADFTTPVSIPNTGGQGSLTITGFNAATGEFSYSYTETGGPAEHNATNDNIVDSFAIVVTDNEGDTASDSLDIQILDTAPQAVADVNAITEDTASVSGNVIDGAADDAGADTLGADAATVTAVTSDNASGNTATTNADGELVIQGEYGTLTIAPNGSYSYALDNTNPAVQGLDGSESVTEVFTYTLTDADSDASSTTLTLTINGQEDDLPTITVTDSDGNVTGADNSVEEDSGETVTGTFTVGGSAGIAGVTVAGVDVTGATQANPVVITTGTQGTLTITGFDAATGEFSYSYTETGGPAEHNAANDNIVDSFAIVVTDNEGDTASDSLDIQILDTAPQAVADVNAITEDTASVSGNVIDGASDDAGADTLGADATTVTAVTSDNASGNTATTNADGQLVIQGEYGTLTIAPDGSYSYALDNTNPAVQGLDGSESVTEVFTYTLTDVDSDASSTTLTLTINGQEDDLPTITVTDSDGNVTGADNSVEEDSGETVTGTFTVGGSAGIAGVTVAGVDVTGATQANPVIITTGTQGTLTITGFDATTGEFSYSYTETGGPAEHNAANDNIVDSFAIVVTDNEGDTASDSLDIQILDTAPQAVADVNAITEDTASVSGNVIDGAADAAGADTLGADATTVTAVTSGNASGNTATTNGDGELVIQGEYGTLTIAPNGSYSYALDNTNPAVQGLDGSESVTEVFTYTLTDADSDASSTTLTLTINGQEDDLPTITVTDSDGNVTGADNSVEEDSGETVTGTFTVGGSAGVASVTIGGVELVGADFTTPVSIPNNGGQGSLTITGFDAATGEFSYSYTETGGPAEHNAANDNIVDSFAIVVTDNEGDTASDSLDIQILDTAPQAVADVNAITEDTASVSGNVIDGAADDAGADTLGADSTTVTAVTSDNASGNTATTNGDGELVIQGEYGTLTIAPNGSYSYALDNTNPAVQGLDGSESVTEVFTYTLTDADSDASSTTLTLTINGQEDDLPTITVTDSDGNVTGADNSVEEDSGETVTGTFTVGGSAGIAGVTVAGVDVTGATQANPVVITTGTQGTLSITGFDAATGEFSYSYTETGGPAEHNAANDNIVDSFAIVVTDNEGDTASDSLDIQILDTAPQAVADVNAITEDTASVSGNVVSDGTGADTLGADATTVTAVTSDNASGNTATTNADGELVIQGEYGTLTIAPDGSYSYALDNTNPAVQGLDGSESVTEVFTYTLTDADSDASSTTLTLTINGQEDDLPTITVTDSDGNVTGADNSVEEDSGETVTGTFTVGGSAGIAGVTVAGIDVTGATQANPVVITTGTQGTLTITGFNAATGEFSYSYTETGGPAEHNAANDNIVDSFAIVVTDNEGDTASDSLDIQILDTAPVAADDRVDGVQSSQVVSKDATEGLLSNDDQGADGARVTAVDLSSLQGSLEWNADGSFVYTATESGSYTEVVRYTITDADGDTSEATLTIQVENGVPSTQPSNVQVNEAGLDGGSQAGNGSATVTGQLVATDPQSDTLTFKAETIKGEYGDIVIRADGSFTYTLTKPVTSSDNPVDDAESFTYTVTDSQGNSATGTITVDVIDDVPQAVNDTPAALQSGTSLTTTADNGLLANDVQGADGAEVVSIDTSGLRGELTWNADGSYTYTAEANASYEEVVTYVIRDADGDTSQTNVKFVVTDGSPTANQATATVSEAGLAAGSDAGSGSHSVSGQLSATDAQGDDLSYTEARIEGDHGVLVISSDGSFTYTLSSAVTGSQADNGGNTLTAQETFTYSVTDAHGNTASASISINIVDDVPQAVDDTAATAEDTAVTVDVLANDMGGADGAVLQSAALAPGHESAGRVTVNSSTGELTFTPGPGVEGTVVIRYTIVDADGDTSEATLTVNVAADSRPEGAIDKALLDEDGLPGGIAGGVGDLAGEATVVSGTLGYSFGADGAASQNAFAWSLSGLPNVSSGGEPVSYGLSNDGRTLTGRDASGALVLSVALTDVASGAYEVTLHQPLDHPDSESEDVLAFKIGYSVTDGDGSSADGALQVLINDDSPEAFTAQTATLRDGGGGSIDFADAAGADGVSNVVFAGMDGQVATDTDGHPLYFEGEALTYRMSADGSQLDAVTADGTVGFSVVLDAAGDSYRLEVSDGDVSNGRTERAEVSDLDLSGVVRYHGANYQDLETDNDVLYSTPNGVGIVPLEGGIGVAGGLSTGIELNEAIRISFLDSLAFSDVGEPSWQGHERVAEVRQTIHVDGDNAKAVVTVAAIDYVADGAGGGSPAQGASSDFRLTVDDVRIVDHTGTDVTSQVGITVDGAGRLVLDGMQDGWSFVLSPEGGMEGIEVTGGGTVPFVLGDMDYRLGEASNAFDIELGLSGIDGDGDTASGSLTLEVSAPDQLFVGDNSDNSVTGGGGSDVMIGDGGGKFTVINPAQNYNVSLILDSSGSMSADSGTQGLSRMALAKQALANLVEQLADFDGIINLQVVDFDTGARFTQTLDLGSSESEVDRIVDYINSVDGSRNSGGGTNYEAAFEASKGWLEEQSAANGYDNLTYFLTDGLPTFYVTDSGGTGGNGRDTGFNEVNNALEAFEGLSAISRVEAIGIGSGINEDVLRFFDNTDVTGVSQVIPYSSASFSGSRGLVDFSGSDSPLDTQTGWTKSGDSTGGLAVGGGSLYLVDYRPGSTTGAAVATSQSFTLEAPENGYSTLQFRYQTDDYGNSDYFRYFVEKSDGQGGWTTVASGRPGESQSWRTFETEPLDSGVYRIVLDVINGSGGYDSITVDDITIRDYEYPTAPVGEASIVNTAEELEAVLNGGSSFDKLAALGDDTLDGTDRADIIFGDTVNTDHLEWTDGSGKVFAAGEHDGLGFSGLFEFLKWSENGGSDPDQDQIMDYIRSNYEALLDSGRKDGGADTLKGGDGDDVLIGGGGNDTLHGEDGDDLLLGGAGDDLLLGGLGADTFAWVLGDQGEAGAAADDVIADFHVAAAGTAPGTDPEADVLDLSDLLQGFDASDDQQSLNDFIHAEQDGDDVVLYIKSDGGLAGDNANADQLITLEGASMSGQSGEDFLTQLLNQGQLDV
ncbi:VCBS domain-containing protein [Halomonas litopenaei]|uniref:VCBS domain-containing protein n=1 Tax=Halomonas litopenaei TaxID=2109328 RepID=UPI001A8C0881|nr:VCBS domain-containing protein [Halomonas litopenaei]MBN8411024.1 VCBS domain-containing protein [Halomonas litopenaei]